MHSSYVDNPSNFTEPLSRTTELNYSSICSCLGSGSISLSVQIDKQACRIKESIAITVQVNNQSNKRVRAIRVYIRERMKLHSQHFPSYNNFGSVNSTEVQENGSFSWNYLLHVPHEATVSVRNVTHVLKVTVVVSGAKNVCIDLPIEITPSTLTDEMLQSASVRPQTNEPATS